MSLDSPFWEPGRHHAVWKEWRRVAKGREGRFFLEHRQAVLESLHAERAPGEILLSRELHDQEPSYWRDLAARYPSCRWALVDGSLLDDVASVPNNTGLCGIYDPAPIALADLEKRDFLLVLWEVTDPGNLGTLVRACQALTEGGLLLIGGCSPWSSKVARASAGTLLKASLAEASIEEGRSALSYLRDMGFRIHSAFPHRGHQLETLAWSGKDAVVLGNESRGLPPDLADSTSPFEIATSSGVESLNVAMTGSIAAWEWRRRA